MGVHHATTMFNETNEITIHGGRFIQNVRNTSVVQSGKGFWALSKEVVPSAFYNAGHDFDLPKCYPNTRVAVLSRIKDWTLDRTDSDASLLWIYGAAGSGKSSIARSIAEWCQEEKVLLASFFFSRSDSLRNNSKRFIATLAYDVIQSVPDCRSIIERVVDSDPHIFSRSIDTQILHLILNPLSQVAQVVPLHTLPHVIIVDGLDECVETEEQTSIMRLFSTTLCNNPHLRWKILIASRPELAIRYSFNDIVTINRSTWLALSDEYKAYKDIRCYLEDNFRRIRRRNPSRSHLACDCPSKEDIDTLVWKSSGQFIYAATVVKFLSSGQRIKARLRTILDVGSTSLNVQAELPFRQLDALYDHILRSAGAGQVEAVTQIIALCILYERCEFRYVCIDTLQPPGEIIAAILGLDIEDVDCILEELGSILQVTETDVRLYHASISDFLFDPNRAGDLWVDERLFWSRIVRYCLRLLSAVVGLGWVNSLTMVIRHASPTKEVTHFLSSFDSSSFLGQIRNDPLLRTALHLSWVHILNLLRERSLIIDDWKSLYRKHVSTYDHWLATLLQDEFSLSHSRSVQVAFVSFRPIPDIAVIVPPSKPGARSPSCLYYQSESGFIEVWLDMFEANQLPKVKAYVLDGQIQAAGVSHCIHFLVKNAVSDHLVRFRPGPDRRKTRPWFWRRRLLATRCQKKARLHSSYPFIPFRTALKSLDAVTPMPRKRLLVSALRSLPHLLDRATISSRLVFALRVALSLTCTSRNIVDIWREAEGAMRKYLVDVAGLKPTMLGFVAPGNVWRYHAWDQLADYGN